MGLAYANLDQTTRQYMLEEIAYDVGNADVYEGRRLTDRGRAQWLPILNQACSLHDDDWLAAQQKIQGLIKTMEIRHVRGKVIEATVPITAAETLAEGEFNRFYIRGVCR
jgi:hypothetical protein